MYCKWCVKTGMAPVLLRNKHYFYKRIKMQCRVTKYLYHQSQYRIAWVGTCLIHVAHEDVIKWKHFPRYWPFVRGIHRSPVNSPHKGQWRGALMFSLICVWINGWVNNRQACDLRRYRTHYDVTVMLALRACNCEVVGWVPPGWAIFHLIEIILFQEQLFSSRKCVLLPAHS